MARPLTKRDPTGTLYTRPHLVQSQIDGMTGQDLTTLRRRLLVLDRSSPDFLRSECLVHLIRDAIRRGDQTKANAALYVLLPRCEANLKAKIPDVMLSNAADVREEVLAQFGELFAARRS
jgi:hypothetical protein